MSKTWIQLVNKHKELKEDPEAKYAANSYDDAVAVRTFYESPGGKEYTNKLIEKSRNTLAELIEKANELTHPQILGMIAKLQVQIESLAEFKYATIEADSLEKVIDDLMLDKEE